jgi:glucose uptake protein GlcU
MDQMNISDEKRKWQNVWENLIGGFEFCVTGLTILIVEVLLRVNNSFHFKRSQYGEIKHLEQFSESEIWVD